LEGETSSFLATCRNRGGKRGEGEEICSFLDHALYDGAGTGKRGERAPDRRNFTMPL